MSESISQMGIQGRILTNGHYNELIEYLGSMPWNKVNHVIRFLEGLREDNWVTVSSVEAIEVGKTKKMQDEFIA